MDLVKPTEVPLLKKLGEQISDMEMPHEDFNENNLIRFLRARNGDVDEAEKMIRKNWQWRNKEGREIEAFQVSPDWAQQYPWTVCGFSLCASPVVVSEVGHWDILGAVGRGQKDQFIQMMLHRLNTLSSLSPSRQFIMILNLEGFSVRQATHPQVLDISLQLARCVEANFPETVKFGVFLNTPWIFQVIWRFVQSFVSTRTNEKIHFLGSNDSEWRQIISQFVHLHQIPRSFGGTASFPSVTDDDRMTLQSSPQSQTKLNQSKVHC